MRKALLADDDFLVRSYLKMLSSWEKAGFEITADVRDGEEALEVLDREKIDLVVTDIAMPLMDGIELIREIRRKYPDIYVIVLSCHDEFEYVKKAMKEGADEYVLKNTLNEESLYTVLEAAEEHIRQSKEEAGVKDQKQQTQEHADMKKDPEEDNNADADGKFLAAICAAIGATVVKAVVGAVVGAIVNCASEYVDDVVENYQKGKRGWDMFVPDSPAEKYAGAAVGGAIAGIGCSSLLWTGVMGATGNVVDGWIAGELDVEGALSGDRRAIENIGLSAASGAYGNVVGKIIGDKLLWDHDYKVHKMPRYARKELATQWFSGGRNEALKQFMNMPIDEFASHFFIRHTIMPATYSTTTNWSMMQISSE